VATSRASRWIFVFGFAKNVRSTIDKDEEVALKKLAASLLALTAEDLAQALLAAALREVECDA
jgi:hypothetical protein